MARKRTENSILTILEDMNVKDEVFLNRSSSYVSNAINKTVLRYPERQYKQICVFTHEKPIYTSLSDFTKITCVIRVR